MDSNTKQDKKVALLILDGWGIGDTSKSDAIYNANTVFFDSLMESFPHSELLTHGPHVGLPEGQMGNSEVGHLNIGAGRKVYQDLALINKEIADAQMEKNTALTELIDYCTINSKPIHLLGLVSDGGVHSHIQHLYHLIEIISKRNVKCIVHAITDGRDTDPHSGLQHILELEKYCFEKGALLSTMIGRYYAMDRDNRWERIKKAYDLLLYGSGALYKSAEEALRHSYSRSVTDEFIEAVKFGQHDLGVMQEGDAVICFNFRTDRCREITQVLTQTDMPEHNMKTCKLNYVTLTRYDASFQNINVMYDKGNLENTLGEVLTFNNKTQVRIAETEKYPHVTFFFNGGREICFEGEERILVPSPKIATYDLQPSMSAVEITNKTMVFVQNKMPDFICLNFANTDMVGHTGVYKAILQAAECVDHCLSKLVPFLLENGYHILVTADHGNSDFAINDDGTPNTAHSMNPVPFIYVSNENKGHCKPGVLADIAPTVLTLMNINIPSQMSGKCLLDF